MAKLNPGKKIRPQAIRHLLVALLLVLAPWSAFPQAFAEEQSVIHNGIKYLAGLLHQPVWSELDISYADAGNPRQRLDLYLPRERNAEKLPVIVFIHGGAWVAGGKSDVSQVLRPYVLSKDYACVAIGYRLSGEARWPAQIHDCKAAIRWIRANAVLYGLDADRIAAWGFSAGGHLALMLGVSQDVPELEGDIGPHLEVAGRVSAVVNFFGVSDLLSLAGHKSAMAIPGQLSPEEMLIGGPFLQNKDKAFAASPMAYVSAGDPPVLTVHGNADNVVPFEQSVKLHEALTKAGVTGYFITVQGGGHGNFGNIANERVNAFLDKYLRGKDKQISVEPLLQPASVKNQ